MGIIISATLLNKFGKEPGTGALSHNFANLTKYNFGVDLPTQLPAYLMASHPRIVTDALTEWVVLFITKNEAAPEDAETSTGAYTVRLPRSLTMRRECITDSLSGQNPGPQSFPDSLPLPIRIHLTQCQVDSPKAQIIEQMAALAQLMARVEALGEVGSND